MANIKSAIKRVKINEKKQAQNTINLTKMRTAVKKFENAVANNNENVEKFHNEAVQQIDKAVSKGLIHRNNGNRQKQRLAELLNA